ncbi:Haloalkane dehalogenase 2 [Frondihabitans sp. 762G35]|uniref:alpha/beta fold hydrolase n=1 Tax=Frondihabitans sp. 762G35 TaxID=1446794 RepID=UPI000D2240C1|nr:alpha/beta fold hydrolase [Frondihabitans sp. 762G35]ARC55935.1 Haloalkane dehalogenase 2 [Frondihabitans sp. 762G35]
MTSRLPRAAQRTAPASLPPHGLPGLDPSFSRLVPAAGRTWHVLDSGPTLDAAGIEPRGTILCVHGNPTWSFLWRSLVRAATEQALAGGTAWRVVAVDQLDMGFSERTGVERDLTLRVGDLADLTDALGLDGRVVTFGHDWGGVISLGWAVDHADQVDAVMLLNTAVHQPETSKIPAPLRLALGKGVLGRATVTTTAFLETTLALAHPALPTEVKEAYRAPYRGADRRGGIGAFVADIPVDETHPSEAERRRVAESIRTLDVPSLLLWGPRDPIFSDRYLDDLLARLVRPDVHRYEGAGHLVAEDVDFASAALTWLDDRFATEPAVAADSARPRPVGPQDAPADPSPSAPPPHRPLWAWLDERRDSDDTALVQMAGASPTVVSWRALSRRVSRLSAGLAASGVTKGDRVSLLVPPGADLTAVLYACLRIGAVVVVADSGLGVKGLTRAVRGAWPHHLIGALPGLTAARALGWPGKRISTEVLPAAAAKALGVDHSLPELASLGAARLQGLPVEPGADDEAAILFTSGSTGPAKGVSYTHAQLAAICGVLTETYGVGPGTGLVAGFAPFALLGPAIGARSVTPDMDVTSPKTLTARAVAEAAREVDATVLFLSPAALANVVATADDLDADERAALGTVTTFLSAGAPVSEGLLERASALLPGATAHTPYGMTEGLLLTDVTLDAIREAGDASSVGGVCVGTPVAGVRVRIAALDDSGHPALDLAETTDAGRTGEICVSAPHLFDHYDRLWSTDRAARRGALAGERWHRTGDVGHLDAAGRVFVEGRLPHVITTADGVVTPVGPEQRVELLAEVARAAVVGVGPAGTQQIVVVAETTTPTDRPALADADLAAEVRRIAGVPIAAVLVVAQLPTDVRHNSKIDRSALSSWAADVLAGGALVAPR